MDVKKRISLFAKELSEIVKKYRIDIVIAKMKKEKHNLHLQI